MQLRNIHRSLGHPLVQKQKDVIENAEIDELPKDILRKLVKLVKHSHAC